MGQRWRVGKREGGREGGRLVGTDETRETSKGEQPKRCTVETKGVRARGERTKPRGWGPLARK